MLGGVPVYDCDICGRSTPIAYVVEIEGARMSLCEKCAKGKAPLQVLGEEKMRPVNRHAPAAGPEEKEMVQDYGKRIRSAREAMGMPAKVLAERINEKESTLIRVENQRMLPDETLRKKLEKELGIKLMEQVQKGKSGPAQHGSEPVSLWDAAVKKEKKQ